MAPDVADDLPDTSLAYTRQTVTAKSALTCAFAPDLLTVELYSGEVFPAGCRRLACPACCPRLARRRALAITAVRPTRMIRMSLVAGRKDESPCTTALIRVKRTRQSLRRLGVNPGEWCFTLEKNPLDTGYHLHCVQTGGYIAQSTLQSACESAGAGIPFINAISRPGNWSSRYGLKGFGADGYGLKTYRAQDGSEQALAINNGRLEHHTSHFFTIHGHQYGVRQAERVALSLRNEGKPNVYWTTSRDEAMRIMDDPQSRQRLIASRQSPTIGARG